MLLPLVNVIEGLDASIGCGNWVQKSRPELTKQTEK